MYINYIIMISKIKPVFRNRVAKYLILNIFEKNAEIDEKRRKKKTPGNNASGGFAILL